MKNHELASNGIRAYQSGEYQKSVQYLSLLVDREPSLWTCRLYLALAHLRTGDQDKAQQQLQTIAEAASDQSVRKKAVDALRGLGRRYEPPGGKGPDSDSEY